MTDSLTAASRCAYINNAHERQTALFRRVTSVADGLVTGANNIVRASAETAADIALMLLRW